VRLGFVSLGPRNGRLLEERLPHEIMPDEERMELRERILKMRG
jgi:hypothetical protein